MYLILKRVFANLDAWIDAENHRRVAEGGFPFPECEISIVGQMSLLANEEVSAVLTLVGTVDIDALLKKVDHPIKLKFLELIKSQGLVYDEDSEKVWLPPESKFSPLFELHNFSVSILDPESALVSKAIKAKEKNRILIQEAIAAGMFPSIVDRITACGGDLKYFSD